MEFLLEINSEEMPFEHVKVGLSQLEERIKAELSSRSVEVKQIRTLGTCRRLVVAADFAEAQQDREEQFIGPPKNVAFTADGSPSPAARGFAKAQGVKVEELEVIKTDRGEYLGLKKLIKGKPTQDILAEILPSVISSLSFPKMMRWESSFRFSRPVRNLLCLFGGRVLPFSVGEVTSGDTTAGHKIFCTRRAKVKSFSEYRDSLKGMRVVVEEEKRKKMISDQMKKKLSSLGAELHPDQELLERLTYEVEHPFVFQGSFPDKYLELPLEVLSTAMREGQKLFSLVKDKKQLPHFLGVADACRDSKSLIQKGNERVLKARLEDAKFFWEQDLKVPLKERARVLNRLIFQEKLGSYEDKAQRLKKISSYLADKIEVKKDKDAVLQAAELCKVDLLTEMVREFPSLQGKMGGLYARQEGCPVQVWKGIYEHYQPLSLDDGCPSTLAGAILSIADKSDSIIGVVGIGVQVTGSKDPFGLRRNAHGICKIVIEKKLHFSLSRLVDKVADIYGEKLQESKDLVRNTCLEFFSNRLRYIFEKQGYRYDLINAAVSAGIDDIYHCYLRLKALDSLKDSVHFEPLVLISKRVNNILRDQPLFKVNPDLFSDKEERELYTTYSIVRQNILPLIGKGDFAQAQRIIFRMRSSIDNFFDHVLVMAEDKKLKRNRIALLQEISKLLLQVADYSQVVIQGQNKSS